MRKLNIGNNSFLLKIPIVFLGAYIGITIGISDYLVSTVYAGADRPHEHPSPMKNLKFEKAFTFDPSKGEKARITYNLTVPAYVTIRVLRRGTRELFLSTIVNFEFRESGTHTETWDGLDYWGDIVDYEKTPYTYSISSEPATDAEKHSKEEFKGIEYEEGMTQEEVMKRFEFEGKHIHGKHEEKFEPLPLLKITLPKPGEILSGKKVVIASVDEKRRGYGDMTGYGVRYYIDDQLIHEEFYEPESNGEFRYELDTTAYEDGKHLFFMGLCDHNDHVTSKGVGIIINNSK